MSPSTAVDERIARARELSGEPSSLPWQSFAEFYRARVYDPDLIKRTFLTYYDDERQVRRSYTYGEFNALVQRVAAFLHDRLGLVRGDRLATILSNHDITVMVYFAAWTLGLAVVPINAEEAPEKKRYILEHSEASAVLCWEGSFEELKQLQGELPALRHVVALEDATEHGSFTIAEHAGLDGASRHVQSLPPHLLDEALIVYTSGTTGPPKGVVLTAENLLIDADAIGQWHRFGPQDRLMCVLPIHHVNGIVVTLVTPFYCKGTAVLNRKFKTGLFWKRLHEEQVTCVSVVPTLLEFLLEANEDLTPYHLHPFGGFICGAGPLLKDTAARFEDRFGFPIRHGYGLSETTCYSCFLPNDLTPEEHRRWLTAYEFPSIGVPLRHNLMTILDQSGAALPELARGEICIKGGTVCVGYFKRPDANEAAFKWGWFRSGDEGYFVKDEQGRPFFFISGRLKELIIRGGVNISPLEIDEVLKGHPGVKFAMAVPFEHRFYGEEIAAYVVPAEGQSGLTPKMLEEFCRPRLPFWKRPKVILFGQEVPYTSTGKPKRLELKAKLASELARYRDLRFKDVA
ncbi:Long-chain fatty acid--CoA ligase [Nitrospira tepida]|uniref:Long-chain fatty acid--CoA ligase n=1 Tax=Nitrospira tepida TaxID=2973512 RepID=A0AA86MVR6_9BACT|nr:class I adenylate-forming enzyme family protein [Nitrospira tepida]CAI4029912.1 Long-chain fatty acid--CoA ligase [Nitrospira tepida]